MCVMDRESDLPIEAEIDRIAGVINAEHARLLDVAIRLIADPSQLRDWECRTVGTSWRGVWGPT